MSKLNQLLKKYQKVLEKVLGKQSVDEALLESITRSLGPSIYQKDASLVSCSDPKEIKRLKRSFLIKKMGLEDGENLDEALQSVCEKLKTAKGTKYRAVFCYLLVDDLGLQDRFSTEETTSTKKNKGSESKEKASAHNGGSPENQRIIKRYAYYAAGAGFIPVPLIDLASITAVQFSMIKRLSQEFDHVHFDDERTKSLVAALMGAIGSFELGLFARVLFRGIPFFGPIIGGTAMSGFAFWSTKLIGEIFDEHFSGGGDLSIEERTIQKMKETFHFEMNRAGKST